MNDPFIYGLLTFSLIVFTLLKSAFSSINLLQLELDKKHNNYYSRILLWISKKPYLISVSINIYFYFVTTALILQLQSTFSSNQSFILLYIIIAIILPFALHHINLLGETFSNKIINLFALALFILFILSAPLSYLFCFLTKILYKKPKSNLEKYKVKESFDKDDLNKLVAENSGENLNEENNSEIKLFRNALQFSETKLRECMIPRTEIISFEITESIELLKQKYINSGLSKILVYRDSIDNIIGYVKSKNIFFSDVKLDKIIKTLPIFPESMSASKLLKFFISTGQNIALVVDEFGGTSGLITTEDILEEIFGEIQDEHDSEEVFERKLNETDFVFSGRIEIDYINDKYNLNIPEHEEYETLAGFILYYTGNIPNANDLITIKEFNIKILKVSETRLELVKLEIKNNY